MNLNCEFKGKWWFKLLDPIVFRVFILVGKFYDKDRLISLYSSFFIKGHNYEIKE